MMLFDFKPEIDAQRDVSGLSYVPNFLTDAEELALQSAIDAEEWDTSWSRRRQPYGATYGPGRRKSMPLPDWGLALAERLSDAGYSHRRFDQMLVNEYLPGQGIALHLDYEPFDRTVASVSLLSDCVMDFRHVEDGRQAAMLVKRRSLLVLTDDARYKWQHGIARRKNDRWRDLVIPRQRRLSITFRALKTEINSV